MKIKLSIVSLACVGIAALAAPPDQGRQGALQSYKIAPSYFVPNLRDSKTGRSVLRDPGAAAFIQTRHGRVVFAPDGATIGIPGRESISRPLAGPGADGMLPPSATPEERSAATRVPVLKNGFAGGRNVAPRVELQGETGGKVNLLVGPRKLWRTGLPSYRQLTYHDVWPDIDVAFLGFMDRLEFRILAGAAGDPRDIVMETGATRLTVDENGTLTAWGDDSALYLAKPLAWQEVSGQKIPVDVAYAPGTDGHYGFELSGYRPGYPLVIDPVVTWSTFVGGSGGSGDDQGAGIAVDAAGNVYVSGRTFSTDFPVTPVAADASLNGEEDIFVTKFNSDGATLAYSTYIGGSRSDLSRGIAVDAAGYIFVTGYTDSVDFPTTESCLQPSYNGGGCDAFLVVLTPAGDQVHYASYLGGGSSDFGYGLALDSSGMVVLAGGTWSPDFPVTAGAIDPAFNGGADAFVIKLDTNGFFLVYSTYLGGNGWDNSYGIALDADGAVTVTGYTYSADFPVTPGAHDSGYNGGGDVFVTRLDSAGASLIYSTFLGGTGGDTGTGIALDTAGNAYVAGFTSSADYPTTAGAFDPVFNGGTDAFVTCLDPTGAGLAYSTYLGGSAADKALGIAVSPSGIATVTGSSSSADFPTTPDSYQPAGGGWQDAFVTRLDPSGSALIYSTFLGGSGDDAGQAVAVDDFNNAYVTGLTGSADYPTTELAFDENFNGWVDAFVTKLEETGSYLFFSTYLGGSSGYDASGAIAVDPAGAVYITGYTYSPDFPTTEGAADSDANGFADVYVTKLTADGASLAYSTYLGGATGSDYGTDLAVDAAGVVTVAGYTGSLDFPVTADAFDNTANGLYDVFVAQLDPAGASLLYATYLGGAGDDFGLALARGENGQLAVAGSTNSPDFPTSPNALAEGPAGGTDAFIVLLGPARLPALQYGTYLGGGAFDEARDISMDSGGNIFVTGRTGSSDFPVSAGALDSRLDGSADAFVAKLDPIGSGLAYATYLGGGSFDTAYGLAIDAAGNATVAGATVSTDFPVTGGAYDTVANGGSDAFVARLNADGTALLYATYLGGSGVSTEIAYGLCLGVDGSATVTGYTNSPDFPTTPHVFDTSYNGGTDAFVTRLSAGGDILEYSAFLGGDGNDAGSGVVQDATGATYVVGRTTSPDFPVTAGSFDPNFNGYTDTFVTRLEACTSPTITQQPAGRTISAGQTAPVQGAGQGSEPLFFQWYKGAAGDTGEPIPDATTESYTTPPLDASLTLWLRVSNPCGHADSSAVTIGVRPYAPTGLTATVATSTKVSLAWQDNAGNEVGFKIERKTGAAGAWEQITTLAADTVAWVNTGLTANTAYVFRARAYNSYGNSGYSNEVAITPPSVPNAPTNLQATAVSYSQIDLVWQHKSGNESGFRIERKTGAMGVWSEIATVGPRVLTYTDTGLWSLTLYTYRVRAYNAAGNSNFTNEASATTPDGPPGTPTALTATPVSMTAVTLAWLDNSPNETGFKIERKTGAAGAWGQIAQTAAGAAAYQDSGLVTNTLYIYRVRATNAYGDSPYSNEASARPPWLPARVTNLTATAVSFHQINLAWTDNANNEDGFRIERKKGTAGAWSEIGTAGANAPGFADTGLAPLTAYVYRVRSYNSAGTSIYSNEASATTLDGPPAAPTSLTARAASGTSITLNWVDNSVNETGFKIERKTGAAGAWGQIALTAAGETAYLDPGLVTNTFYYYRVRATNAMGDSEYSNEANTRPPLPPARVTNLTAVAVSFGQINLAWTDNATNEEGFRIERKKGVTGVWSEIGTAGLNAVGYADTGASSLTTYVYRVRSYNAGGTSIYSNEAVATTPDGPPGAPFNLTAAPASSTSLTLSWIDNSGNETGFKIERKTGATGAWSQIALTAAGAVTFLDSALVTNTLYYYRVRATNAAGDSAYSNEASARPPWAPSRVTNLTATAISFDRITLAWTDNANNEDGFRIERKKGATGTWSEIGTAGVNAVGYADTGLVPLSTYSYRVRSYNAGGTSIYSNEASATTPDGPPASPLNLTARAASGTSIVLNWTDNSPNENVFMIERKTTAAGIWGLLAAVPANTTTFLDQGLITNTFYYYRLRAVNSFGSSAYSNEANTRPPLPPARVTNLAAAAVSSSQINLSWTDNATNEDGFRIERKRGLLGIWSEIGTAGVNATGYADTGAFALTTFIYRVRSYNASGTSIYSNEASATTPDGPPGAPSNLAAAAASSTSIALTWADNSANETGFKIERKTGSAGAWSQIAQTAAGVAAYLNSGLVTNTSYYYRVRATNGFGDSAYSNEANARPPVAPARVTNLAAEAISNNAIRLTWTDNATNEDGFRVERKKGAAGTWGEIGTAGMNTTVYTDAGLPALTTYYYRVRTYNAAGTSIYSDEAAATTLNGPPAAPSGLTASAVSSTAINLSWVDNSPNESGFQIERKAGVAGAWSQIVLTGAGVTTYRDPGVSPNTLYTYRVRGTNSLGDSAYSNEASARTPN